MPTSRIVDFRHRQLKLNTQEDVQNLFKDVDSGEVEELYMSGNTIGALAGQELGVYLKQMPLLKVANLSDIITSRSIEEVPLAMSSICDALIECKELVELDLSNNAFGIRVAPLLVPLFSQRASIQVLKLNNNGLGPEAGNIVAGALLEAAKRAESLDQPSNLRVLTCGRNRLGDGSANLWGEVLAAHKNLQKVRMVNNGFHESGVIAIAQGLKKCRDLRHLSLRDGTAQSSRYAPSEDGKRGWHTIADVVREAPALEFLDLSDCGLTQEGNSELIQALSETVHPNLDTILLENNDMGTAHYDALKDIFSSHLPALKLLDLALNEDLEDNDVITEMVELLEGRGGQLVLEDPDEDADLERNALDVEKETRFIKTPLAAAEAGADVGELADLLSTGLKIVF